MKFAKTFFFLTIFLYPFYVLPSGSVQPASATLLITTCALFFVPSIRLTVTPAIFRMFLFVAYTVLVNVTWFIYTQNSEFLLYIAAGGFTAIAFFTSATLARHMTESDGRQLLQVILATIVVQIAIYLLGFGRPSYRAINYFNNPNQLGYFCVISASAALVISHLYRISGFLIPTTIIAATVLATFSLSKASFLSCLIVLIITLFFSSSMTIAKKFIVIGIVSMTLIASVGTIMQTEFYERLEKRANGFRPDNDDSLSIRGYSRIIDFPENIVWGVGEGFFTRFDTAIELHSFPATILFAYGIIGSLLFLVFLKSALGNWRMLLYLSPVAFYNLSHHGGRVMLFWILIGIVAARVNVSRRRSSRIAPRARHRGGVRAHGTV